MTTESRWKSFKLEGIFNKILPDQYPPKPEAKRMKTRIEEVRGVELKRPLRTPKTNRIRDIMNSGDFFLTEPTCPREQITSRVRKHKSPENKFALSPGIILM